MSIWIWGTAGAVYLLFLFWYFNWSGKIKLDEVDAYLDKVKNSSGGKDTELEIIREFLCADDGKEFFMQNFIKYVDGKVFDPSTCKPVEPSVVLRQQYLWPLGIELLKRGGHPVFMAAPAFEETKPGEYAGGYIDSWCSDPNPGWSGTAMMRYRSRRDMIEIMIEPRFADIHKFKKETIKQTVSFPVKVNFGFFTSPKYFFPQLS